jgi:hypothetical protein
MLKLFVGLVASPQLHLLLPVLFTVKWQANAFGSDAWQFVLEVTSVASSLA